MTGRSLHVARSALLLALLALGCGTVAQVNIDSLRTIALDRSKPDSVRFTAWDGWIWEGYLYSEPDSAYLLAEQMRQEAKRLGSLRYEASAIGLKATSWYVRGENLKALDLYAEALALHERCEDRVGCANALTNMAAMHSLMGAKDTALSLYRRGVEMHTALHDSLSLANDLNAIGTIHMARSDHARAVESFGLSLAILRVLNDQRGIAVGEANLGNIEKIQGDFRAAIEHYRETIRIARSIGDKHKEGRYLVNMGSCLQELGRLDSAMALYDEGLAIEKEIDDTRGLVNCLNSLGDLYRLKHEPQRALDVYSESASVARAKELPYGLAGALTGTGRAYLDLSRPSEAMAWVEPALNAAREADEMSLEKDAVQLRFLTLRALNEPAQALIAYERYVQLSDSINADENQRAVLRNEYAYAYEKQAYADSVTNALNTQQERIRSGQRETTERSRRNFALAFGAVLVVVALAVWQRARLLRRTNAAILAAQEKLVESERRREASDVRTRIARDIHDELGSELTKIAMLGRHAKRTLSGSEATATLTAIERMRELSKEVGNSLGDVVWAVDPQSDTAVSLVDRAREFTQDMLADSGLQAELHFSHAGADRAIAPSVRRDIFLVLKEALNNAVKHGQASRIGVSFTTSADHFELRVEDDGVGFDPATFTPGNGWHNMRARAANVGAELTFRAGKPGGTTMELLGRWA